MTDEYGRNDNHFEHRYDIDASIGNICDNNGNMTILVTPKSSITL